MNYEVQNVKNSIKRNSALAAVPGSKSITARAMLAAALADGQSTLCGASLSDDGKTFLSALNSFGIESEINGNDVHIRGCGGKVPVKKAEIYVGNAGTAARFLTALAAFSDGEYAFTSSPRMCVRPQEELIKALERAGARFTFHGEKYCFPFTVAGKSDVAESITIDISKSSQYLSALLLCAPCAAKPPAIISSGFHGMDYVDMTADVMWSFGVTVKGSGDVYTVDGRYAAKRYDIEPDISAACYFYAANRILGTDIKVRGVTPHTVQGDYKFIELIKNFDGGKVDMSAFSDQALTLCAVAPYFSRPTEICNIVHVRGQECDRIKAACSNLSAMGVKVEEREDGLKIYPAQPHAAQLDSFGDHRVAMSFALTGLRADGIIIRDAEVCFKTFPQYFSELDKVLSILTK